MAGMFKDLSGSRNYYLIQMEEKLENLKKNTDYIYNYSIYNEISAKNHRTYLCIDLLINENKYILALLNGQDKLEKIIREYHYGQNELLIKIKSN